MAKIVLPSGDVVQVDQADVALVSQYKWSVRRHKYTDYAVMNAYRDGKRVTVGMHRLLMGEPDCDVDHRNRNGLDNRRSNLRMATRSQNNANCIPWAKSGFKGVYPNKNRWQAKGGKDGVIYNLGHFVTKEEAAHAYDEWAKEAHGEFARLNFPEMSDA